jgi:hypothetical protein
MRKIIAVALWAWIPFFWQPLWGQTQGQTPSGGVEEGKEPKHYSGTGAKTTQEGQRGTAEAPFVVDTQGHKQTKAEAAKAKAEKDYATYLEGRTLYFAGIAAYATAALVFIGLCGVIAAVCTLKKIERQTAAALLNTQAVINSERPWISINVESPTPNQFVFRAVNVGRTPAKVTAIWSSPLRVSRGAGNIQLADGFFKEPLECLFAYPPCFLPPTKDCIVGRDNIEELRGSASRDLCIMGIAESLVMVYFYGRIVYYDALDPKTPRETRFFYRLLPIVGALPFPDPEHPEYNDYK